MASGASFLGGAHSRLLPPDIPFRYFGAAVAYHLLAWLALLAAAPGWPHWTGGLGWPLAALHLLTLGVLVMTAIGASLQLLPVATRQAVRSTRWPLFIWWLYTPGVAMLALGMGLASPWLLGLGAAAVLLALLAYAALLAINLHGARGMPVVAAHVWVASASLLIVLGTALALASSYLGLGQIDRGVALSLHLSFAAYGFMGMLALGLSYILVPMFALAPAPDVRHSLASGALALSALVLAALAALGVAPLPLRLLAAALGAMAVLLHLRLMHAALRVGMRKTLGRSLALMRIAWAALLVSLACAAMLALNSPWPDLPMLFGVVLIGGWLLSFLLGVLQRILPFLASMHVVGHGKRTPTPSSLGAEQPLAIHFVCHLVALAGLAAATAMDSTLVASLSAAVGAVGAVAFAAFFVIVMRRLAAHRPPQPLANRPAT